MGGTERPVKKVMISAVLVFDYEELDRLQKSGKGHWSPTVEAAKLLDNLPGLYEVVEVSNLTVSRTGQEYEEGETPQLEE